MNKLTKEQAVIITGFTGVTACPFSVFHEELEKRLGRPVFTHELASQELWETKIKPAFREDFLAICPETK